MPQRPIRKIIENQRLFTLSAHTAISDAARRMKQSNIGAAPVVEDGRLVGIFTERDALFRVLAEGRDPQATQVAEVMTRNPQTIHPDKPFGHALHMMYEGGFRHVPVVARGRPVGMVSARDALGPELREFESQLSDREHIGEILG
jgi:CBS domain-containing protein